MGSRKTGRPKTQKPCARWPDADRNRRSASGDPAMVLVFRMASIFRVVTGTVPVTPAAELLLDAVRLSMIFQEKPISTSPQSCPSRRIVFSKTAKKHLSTPRQRRRKIGMLLLRCYSPFFTLVGVHFF